jgi:MoxR-like ATPase
VAPKSAQIRKPAFLWGSPGVGKSQIVAQVAASLGVRLIDIRAVLLDPVDLRGLPTVEHGKAAWAIPAFLPEDGAGILFLDELNAAPPLVQAACYQPAVGQAVLAQRDCRRRTCRARWPIASSI